MRPCARNSRRHRQVAAESRARAAARGHAGRKAMNDLESRLEELFMADSRARRVGRVFLASRGSTFLGNAAFVGALALAALAAIVALGPLRLSQEQAAAPT